MALPRDWHAVVGDLRVAFEDHVRVHIGMLRTLHVVALAGYAPPAIAHGPGSGNHFAAVVGCVTHTDQIYHFASLWSLNI